MYVYILILCMYMMGAGFTSLAGKNFRTKSQLI